MKHLCKHIVAFVGIFILSLGVQFIRHYRMKEGFIIATRVAPSSRPQRHTRIELSNEEQRAINNDFNEGNTDIYAGILKKYGLPSSDLHEKNYCDARGLQRKFCPLKLIYSSK